MSSIDTKPCVLLGLLREIVREDNGGRYPRKTPMGEGYGKRELDIKSLLLSIPKHFPRGPNLPFAEQLLFGAFLSETAQRIHIVFADFANTPS